MVWFGGQKSAQERKRVEPNERAEPEGWTKKTRQPKIVLSLYK